MFPLDEFTYAINHDAHIRIGRVPVFHTLSYQQDVPQGVRLGILSDGKMIGRLGNRHDHQVQGPSLFLMANTGTSHGEFVLVPPCNICFVSLVMGLEGAEACGLDAARLIGNGQGGFAFRTRPACSTAMILARQIAACPFRGAARTLYVSGKALELASLVANAFPPAEEGANGSGSLTSLEIKRLRDVRQMLLDNLNDPPSLAELARLHGMNIKKLSSGFQTLFGSTVFSFVTETRLKRSFQLLTSGEMTVSQVAYYVGYNVSYFSTLFKKRFGVSPNEIS